ncbi:MAG: hypothetical protein JHC46_06795 [Solirubrobacteraceae bacterium]|nr:hypothetical protein [Solirubrobacteraceae bacterium]
MLAARWASAWFEKSLQRPLLAPRAGAVSASVVERFVVVVVVVGAVVLAVVVLVSADSLALLVVDSALPQAASRSALAAAKAASEGALMLSGKRFKTASTLCQSVYCGVGGSLRII